LWNTAQPESLWFLNPRCLLKLTTNAGWLLFSKVLKGPCLEVTAGEFMAKNTQKGEFSSIDRKLFVTFKVLCAPDVDDHGAHRHVIDQKTQLARSKRSVKFNTLPLA